MLGLYRTWKAGLEARWEWFKEKSKSKNALWWLGLYSFFHSIILPVPTDFLLVPMALADRRRAALFVIVSSVTATLGAAAGYLVASVAYSTLALPLVSAVGLADDVAALAASLDQFTFAATLVTALTPLPDVPVILAAGLLHMNVAAFLLAYFIGRVLRLGGVTLVALAGIDVAGLIKRFFSRI
jgi:membrane protein YqaA with SNARE-associated domain